VRAGWAWAPSAPARVGRPVKTRTECLRGQGQPRVAATLGMRPRAHHGWGHRRRARRGQPPRHRRAGRRRGRAGVGRRVGRAAAGLARCRVQWRRRRRRNRLERGGRRVPALQRRLPTIRARGTTETSLSARGTQGCRALTRHHTYARAPSRHRQGPAAVPVRVVNLLVADRVVDALHASAVAVDRSGPRRSVRLLAASQCADAWMRAYLQHFAGDVLPFVDAAVVPDKVLLGHAVPDRRVVQVRVEHYD